MVLLKKKDDIRRYLDRKKQQGVRVGFVPTMGALHQGHISLVESSRKDNSITVCSIFVNPAQFNDPKDFEKYPVTIDRDINMLEAAGCDVLFLPALEEIYPDGTKTGEKFELGYLETILEGKYRPGHFQGVCMVMQRLLEIVMPGSLYLGQKDYQQCMVIKKLINDNFERIVTVVCPIIREPDGLAMSSRNMRLNEEERKKAPAIYSALQSLQQNLQKEDLQSLKSETTTRLTKLGFKVDYIEIADASTLLPVTEWNGSQKLVALAAAFLNEVRLIDNLLLK
ncbi:MAG TPA: pantoate--beta-alanine ligase [Chitinophagaceae bacterium]|nr:pantoate--beta-alanine ligase [Chitinophagaceae bacterium]